jgi:hypothetical protein
MADSDEKLSPEEKLLQVIQGSEPEEGKTSSDAPLPKLSSKAVPPAETVAPAEEAPVPKSKLKLAKKDELDAGPAVTEPGTKPAAKAPVAEDTDPPPVSDVQTEPPTMAAPIPEKKAEGRGKGAPAKMPAAPVSPIVKETGRRDGVRIANRSFSAVAVAIIALVGYELWGSTRPAPPEVAGKVPFVDAVANVEPLPSVDTFRSQFASRSIWDLPLAQNPTNAPVGAVNPVYAAIAELDMMGISPLGDSAYEALVVDKATGQMHFVRKGQQVPVLKTNRVDVADVRKDFVMLSYDGKEFRVK